MLEMVTVEQAHQIIAENTKSLDKIVVQTPESFGYVLSENIKSTMNLPPFPQSAMDGFACKLSELKENSGELAVYGESKAGSSSDIKLELGSAMRIFTGAPIPAGADCVIKQEDVLHLKDFIQCEAFGNYSLFQNIRQRGEEIKIGKTVLKKGHIINPATIGLLVSMGIEKVEVVRKPRISAVVTGDELARLGEKRKSGQIYESNSHILKSALTEFGFGEVDISNVSDDLEATKTRLKEAAANNEVLIISGGISVGDYDYVGKALQSLGVKEFFYKIRQKPGKPMFFGTLNNCSVFALPGNPGSMLTCFYVYVLPAIFEMSGRRRALPEVQLKLAHGLSLKGERAHFLKAAISGGEVNILSHQNSSMLSSFAIADCLVYLPQGVNKLSKGDLVKVIYLQYSSR